MLAVDGLSRFHCAVALVRQRRTLAAAGALHLHIFDDYTALVDSLPNLPDLQPCLPVVCYFVQPDANQATAESVDDVRDSMAPRTGDCDVEQCPQVRIRYAQPGRHGRIRLNSVQHRDCARGGRSTPEESVSSKLRLKRVCTSQHFAEHVIRPRNDGDQRMRILAS